MEDVVKAVMLSCAIGFVMLGRGFWHSFVGLGIVSYSRPFFRGGRCVGAYITLAWQQYE